jgi:hypothetical protein
MRLAELNPKWVLPPNWSAQAPPFYIGVSFDCPCPKCMAEACATCGHRPEPRRLAVMFWPPVDPANAAAAFAIPVRDNGGHRRTGGDSLDSLTLSPSVGFDSIGHWHGHIQNGEVTK